MVRDKLFPLREFIGLEVQVIRSPCRELVGLHGRVIEETKNTFVVLTEDGERIFPKHRNVFRFFIEKETIDVDGSKICYRSVERIKKVRI